MRGPTKTAYHHEEPFARSTRQYGVDSTPSEHKHSSYYPTPSSGNKSSDGDFNFRNRGQPLQPQRQNYGGKEWPNKQPDDRQAYNRPGEFRENQNFLNNAAGRIGEERNVFVSNIHFECTQDDLHTFFTENGLQIEKLNLHRDKDGVKAHKGTAHCLFVTAQDAAFAVKELSGFEYQGRPLKMEIARPMGAR